MPWTKCSILLVLIFVTGGSARADEIELARQHYAQGSKDFDLGLYDKAIQEYMAAYDAKPDPALLYNIAQAHKLAGHPMEAVRFYRTYLSRVPDAPYAEEVRAKVVELQKAIAQQQRAQAMPPDQIQPLDSAQPAPSPPVVTPAAAPPVAEVATERDAHRGRARQVAGGVVAGIGLAALAAGIGLAVTAKQDSDQLTAIDRQRGVFDPGKDSSGRTLGTVGPVLIGVGTAAVVVGGVVFAVGRRASERARMAAAR